MTDLITKLEYDYFGLPIFEIDGEEYAVAANKEKADTAVREEIEQSLWAFNAEFIIKHTELPTEAVQMLKFFQEKKCEDANETFRALIKDMDDFVGKAVEADGRGHFLARYDGNERRLDSLDRQYWGQILGVLKLGTRSLREVLVYRIN